MQMHNSRLSKGRNTLNELNDEIDDLNKLDNQRFQDAGMKTNQFSRRTAPNSARPRTPVEDSNNPFDRMKLEEELAKYKRYLKFELPDIVTKQVNDIFEREETGLKSLMSERDQLLKMQLNSFHEYLSIMDQSRVRELSDMNNLKLEVDGLKRANDVRVSTVHRALNETDQMLADEIEWKRIANSYRPATFYQTDENLKPYSLDTNDMWNEGKYLRGVSSNVDIRRDLNHDKSAIRRVHSSMVGLSPEAGAYNDINESDTARKSRIDDIIHELDHLMDDMNNPGYYKLPKNTTFTN